MTDSMREIDDDADIRIMEPTHNFLLDLPTGYRLRKPLELCVWDNGEECSKKDNRYVVKHALPSSLTDASKCVYLIGAGASEADAVKDFTGRMIRIYDADRAYVSDKEQDKLRAAYLNTLIARI